ncbi:TetR/AcrR family transcriptional regulator [Mycolicibacterium sp. GF69]|uniref:TetR/AcrR family transcriptional regulator n=1 Tax=Mycolicibacterium sp. GF69 TaxID=2267251 RepID=UPI000DCE4BCF|nr:TetR/AcrR family transcriptional regulator [Mycolicibacterium sp. GF69]RAV09586.1 TetR/AcrR family transcriptional regulator [Mycolicibacterium sp. GF69]
MAPGRTPRLSVDDWIQAGYAILAEQGIKALKLDSLCARVGATKGSFYWHFTDMAGYRSALVRAWGELRDDDRRHFAALSELPPRERLSQMMSALVDDRHWTLERAMREWARTDELVAEGVRASDGRVLDAVRQAFVDHGFDPDEADLRANATFAAGVGFLHLSRSNLSRSRAGAKAVARRERFLDIMLA